MSSEQTPAIEDPIGLEPTEAELEEWAKRERKRREAWLAGPTPEERAAYAARERERRRIELTGEDPRAAELARMMRKYPREAQLAAEGAMSLFVRWSRHMYTELVRAGHDWEAEVSEPGRRRRVPIDDDET